MPEIPPCDPQIFKNGTLVLMTHTIGSAAMECWVKQVAQRSEQPVDWHFAGGRACVMALGDLDRVRAAIGELMPEHDRLQTEAAEASRASYRLKDGSAAYGPPFVPSCTLYRANEVNYAHEYVRQHNADRGDREGGTNAESNAVAG